MCGRYVLHTPASFIAKTYWNHQMPVGDLVARYNITPGSQILSVRLREDDLPSFDLAYWGFKPAWAKEGAPTPINARIESLRSPYFRTAFQKQRCVIPASGWYEWKATPEGKQPYYITCPSLGREEALMFAGIFTPAPTGTTIHVAIITEPAASKIEHIHGRQPVLIDPSSLDDWLNPQTQDPGELKGHIQRTDPESLAYWPVSKGVNKPEGNDPHLIAPLPN